MCIIDKHSCGEKFNFNNKAYGYYYVQVIIWRIKI